MGYFHSSSTSLPCSSLCPLLHFTAHCHSPSQCHILGAPQSTRLPTGMVFQPWPLLVASGRLVSALLRAIRDDLPRFKTTDAPDTMPSLLILDSRKPSGSAPPGTGPERYSHNCTARLCCQPLLVPCWLGGASSPLSLRLTCRGVPKGGLLGLPSHTAFSFTTHSSHRRVFYRASTGTKMKK